jgi:hypothetical protein
MAALLACLVMAGAAGCRRASEPAAPEPPLVQTVRHEGIELTLTADPPKVRLDRDVWLTIRVASSTNVTVAIPSIEDRLSGLATTRRFEREPETAGGRVTREICFWLTPRLASEYRVAPLAITYRDMGATPAREGWFPTRPLVLPAAPVRDGPAPDSLAPPVGPRWIRPPARALAGYVLLAVLALGLAALAWRLGRRVRRAIELRRLSPRERALRELEDLLARDLPGRARVKEFYLEITRIVRQYIERSHGVRAPEQTTQEFLSAALQDPRFDRESIRRLREFLTAADLVKFAALIPDPPTVANTARTARDYIVADADRLEAASAARMEKGHV